MEIYGYSELQELEQEFKIKQYVIKNRPRNLAIITRGRTNNRRFICSSSSKYGRDRVIGRTRSKSSKYEDKYFMLSKTFSEELHRSL